MALAMFCVGTTTMWDLKDDLSLIMIGLIILGCSLGMISIPVLPEMLEAVEERPELKFNIEELENYCSGLFVICTGLGEAIGPILSSCLYEAYEFRTA